MSSPIYAAYYEPEDDSKELIGFFTGDPVDIALYLSSKPVGYCSVLLQEIAVVQVQEQPVERQLAYLRIVGKSTTQLSETLKQKQGYEIIPVGDYVAIEKK